eukprot:CAMPEP_0185829948 /NCGR_PEP_ID=MMETSP1353-20130828/542_1 /TAXON_ID=1077150 /ORGANISM="Erythrolobus australicus, Strain CCMP3124" /LENGTH=203 /DNA_ID=CAMNT_0028527795 /DNA_START=156 /DNA_END=767 /DNA_ORIENTATION=+
MEHVSSANDEPSHIVDSAALRCSRRAVLINSAAAAATAAAAAVAVDVSGRCSGAASWSALAEDVAVEDPDLSTKPSGLKFKFIKKGDALSRQVQLGDLVGIRFTASYNGFVFDNTFETAEPYFIRVGSGNVPPGVEEALLLMSLGDRLKLVVPGQLAFGKKGRRASAGKPSIPPNATIVYELELSEFPGFMQELIDLGDGAEY